MLIISFIFLVHFNLNFKDEFQILLYDPISDELTKMITFRKNGIFLILQENMSRLK